jgi:hypothetical protein
MQYTIQNTEYSCSQTHVHKITNVPVFIWRLVLMILMGANPLLSSLEGMGPESLDFFGPKWHSLHYSTTCVLHNV